MNAYMHELLQRPEKLTADEMQTNFKARGIFKTE